jgi:hypothetical protein
VFGVTSGSLGFKASCPLLEFVAVVPDIVVLIDNWCAVDPMGSSLVLCSTNDDTLPSGHPGAGPITLFSPSSSASDNTLDMSVCTSASLAELGDSADSPLRGSKKIDLLFEPVKSPFKYTVLSCQVKVNRQ